MPYFQRRKPDTVEAYRLPLGGEEPSDGLVFFLKEIRLYFVLRDPLWLGKWVVLEPSGKWCLKSDEEFRITYKPLPRG